MSNENKTKVVVSLEKMYKLSNILVIYLIILSFLYASFTEQF